MFTGSQSDVPWWKENEWYLSYLVFDLKGASLNIIYSDEEQLSNKRSSDFSQLNYSTFFVKIVFYLQPQLSPKYLWLPAKTTPIHNQYSTVQLGKDITLPQLVGGSFCILLNQGSPTYGLRPSWPATVEMAGRCAHVCAYTPPTRTSTRGLFAHAHGCEWGR